MTGKLIQSFFYSLDFKLDTISILVIFLAKNKDMLRVPIVANK